MWESPVRFWLYHKTPISRVAGFGTRLRELDFFSFFRFTEGFFDGGVFLLPGLSFRDDWSNAEGGFLPDAIICSSSSLWYAWCNVNSNKDTCKINMCGQLGTQNRGHLIIVELCNCQVVVNQKRCLRNKKIPTSYNTWTTKLRLSQSWNISGIQPTLALILSRTVLKLIWSLEVNRSTSLNHKHVKRFVIGMCSLMITQPSGTSACNEKGKRLRFQEETEVLLTIILWITDHLW
jgi:hypothetical protein